MKTYESKYQQYYSIRVVRAKNRGQAFERLDFQNFEASNPLDGELLTLDELLAKLKHDVNAVLCGRCGHEFLHETDDAPTLQCPDCLFKGDPCNFPDLNSDGEYYHSNHLKQSRNYEDIN